MTNLVNYANTGSPLVFDDPFPLSFNTGFGVTGCQPKPSAGGGGMMGGGSPPPEPKADNGQATSLMRALGSSGARDSVVFDVSNLTQSLLCYRMNTFLSHEGVATPSRSIPILISPRYCKR